MLLLPFEIPGLEFICLSSLCWSCWLWLLHCILNTHLVKPVLIFLVPRSLGSLTGNRLVQLGPFVCTHVFTATLVTSGPLALPQPYLNVAPRDQILCCYDCTISVIFQELWLSFLILLIPSGQLASLFQAIVKR